ncbi:tRNA methyltransferase [Listeria monocytogenes]|nr:tRNA methyltransferase [Listeria monocytogenes]
MEYANNFLHSFVKAHLAIRSFLFQKRRNNLCLGHYNRYHYKHDDQIW